MVERNISMEGENSTGGYPVLPVCGGDKVQAGTPLYPCVEKEYDVFLAISVR